MNRTVLDKIISAKQEKVARQKLEPNSPQIREKAYTVRSAAETHRLRSAMARRDRMNIIAEIKRASPSKGIINENIDVAAAAREYQNGGAAAISVLTEENFFSGELADLVAVKAAADLPVLRKDFVIDEFQVYESAAAGADAVLLIVAALNADNLGQFLRIGRDELGIDVIVEVHSAEELELAAHIGADIIGVNNRDLHTFEVSLEVSRRLIDQRPDGCIMIAESGISNRSEIDGLYRLGFDGFLIGESLMRSGNVVSDLSRLTSEVST